MNQFTPYTSEHFIPLLFFFIAGALWIFWAMKTDVATERNYTWLPVFILPGIIVFDLLAGVISGSIDVTEDLPFHMCRLVTFLLPLVLWKKKRYLFGVLYFWILAGTLQALLTPDLKESFPDYQYIRYWTLHCGLIAGIMYPIVVFGFRPSWRDMWHAWIWAQVYLVLSLALNLALGSNYGYTMRKPEMASVADFLGPWPWYLLTAQLIVMVLFVLVYLPFAKRKESI